MCHIKKNDRPLREMIPSKTLHRYVIRHFVYRNIYYTEIRNCTTIKINKRVLFYVNP